MTPEEQAAADAAAKAAAENKKEDLPEGEDKDVLIARLQAQLHAANGESAGRRKKLEELEAEKAKREQDEMSELERERKARETAEADAAKARAEAKELLLKAAFVSEAAKAGVSHPEDVFVLADRSAVTIGDDGKIEGVAEAVKALVDSGRVPLAGKKPAPKLDGGAGGGDRSQGNLSLTPEELEMAKAMGVKPEAYAANKAALAKERAEQE